MDDNVQREYSQFETEDEDDDDDIFMEPEYSIGGTQPTPFVSGELRRRAPLASPRL
jgi:hypothetical protein